MSYFNSLFVKRVEWSLKRTFFESISFCFSLIHRNAGISYFFLLPVYDRESIDLGLYFWSSDFHGFKSFDVPLIRKSHFSCRSGCKCVISIVQKQTLVDIPILNTTCVSYINATENILWKSCKLSVYRGTRIKSHT